MAAGSRMPWSRIGALVTRSGESAVEVIAKASRATMAAPATRSGRRSDSQAGRVAGTGATSAGAEATGAGARTDGARTAGARSQTPSVSTIAKSVWEITWIGPTFTDTWATSKTGVSSITATKAGHGRRTAQTATAAATNGTIPATTRAGSPAWMS